MPGRRRRLGPLFGLFLFQLQQHNTANGLRDTERMPKGASQRVRSLQTLSTAAAGKGTSPSVKKTKHPTASPAPTSPTAAPRLTPFPVASPPGTAPTTPTTSLSSFPTQAPRALPTVAPVSPLPVAAPLTSAPIPVPTTPLPTTSAAPTPRPPLVTTCPNIPDWASNIGAQPLYFEYQLTLSDNTTNTDDAMRQVEETVHNSLVQAFSCEFHQQASCQAHAVCAETLVDPAQRCCPNDQGMLESCCDLQLRSFYTSQWSSAPLDTVRKSCEDAAGDDSCIVVLGGVTPDVFYDLGQRRRLNVDEAVATAVVQELRPAIDGIQTNEIAEAKFLGLVDSGIALGPGDDVDTDAEQNNDDGGAAGAQQFREASSGNDSNLVVSTTVAAVAVVTLVALGIVAARRRRGRDDFDAKVEHVELAETFSEAGNIQRDLEPEIDYDGGADYMAEPQFDRRHMDDSIVSDDRMAYVVDEVMEEEEGFDLSQYAFDEDRSLPVQPTFVSTHKTLRERAYVQEDTVDL